MADKPSGQIMTRCSTLNLETEAIFFNNLPPYMTKSPGNCQGLGMASVRVELTTKGL